MEFAVPSPLWFLHTNATRFWTWITSRFERRAATSRDLAFRRREEQRLRGLRLKPDFESLERREVPNDPLGMVQAPLLGSGLALLGASLKSPASVLAHGWDDSGANPDAVLRGADELPSRSNYFRGGEHPLKVTDVPNYARVIAEDVYPGIDVAYHSTPARA
jgi:hypothetical protein